MRVASEDRPVDDVYLKLIRRFPLRAIRTEKEHRQAIEVLLPLAGRDERLSQGEREYQDALTVLVQEYERRKHHIDRIRRTPLQRLEFLMQERGMTPGDLGLLIGNKSAAPMILTGKRELTREQILKLADHFAVDPGYFL